MNRSDLIIRVCEKARRNRKETEVIIDTIFDSMAEALCRGEKVELRGFGSFKVKERLARLGRNPKTGEKVNITSKRALLFKPAKELRARVDS